MTEICSWISSSYGTRTHLSGIIYLHNMDDPDINCSSSEYKTMFQRLCGPNGLHKVILTIMPSCNYSCEKAEEYERRLRDGDFWGGLVADGAARARFHGSRESGLELIDQLMGDIPRPLNIRYQMVEAYTMTEDERERSRVLEEKLARESPEKIYEAVRRFVAARDAVGQR